MSGSYSYYDIENLQHESQQEKGKKSSQSKKQKHTAEESTPSQPNSDRKDSKGGIFSRLGSQSEKSHDLRESLKHGAVQNDAENNSQHKKSLKKGNSGQKIEESKSDISGHLDKKINPASEQQNQSNASPKDNKRLLNQLSDKEEAAKAEEIARFRKERRKQKKERKKQERALQRELEKDADSIDTSSKKSLKVLDIPNKSVTKDLQAANGNKASPVAAEEQKLEEKYSKKSKKEKGKKKAASDESEEEKAVGKKKEERYFEEKGSEKKKGKHKKQDDKRERSRSHEKRNEKSKDQKQEQGAHKKKSEEERNKHDLRETIKEQDSGKKNIKDRIQKRDRSREKSLERDQDQDHHHHHHRHHGDRNRDDNRRNRDRSRERSQEKHRDRSNEGYSNHKDWRSDRYTRDNSDGRYSKPNTNSKDEVGGSEPETENFLKFPEDENAPKKEKKPMFKNSRYSNSRENESSKNPEMTEEDVLSRIGSQKLTFALDIEPVTWKAEMAEEQGEEKLPDENGKSNATPSNPKRGTELRSGKKERSFNYDEPKSCYKIFGQDRMFYTRDTNIVSKLQDYLVEANTDEPQEAKDEQGEEKKEDADELEELYSYQHRYFIDNPTQVCRRCRRGGHFERMCPETLTVRCLFCCGEHLTSTCDSFICFRCNGLGHKTKDCTFSGGGSCFRCQKRGHKASYCGVMIQIKRNPEGCKNERDGWKQETRCLCCEKFNHINCNADGIATGTEDQVDDLYSQKLLMQIEKEIEQMVNSHGASQKKKSKEHPVLIEGALHTSSEGEDDSPKKPVSRQNNKGNQSNSKQKLEKGDRSDSGKKNGSEVEDGDRKKKKK